MQFFYKKFPPLKQKRTRRFLNYSSEMSILVEVYAVFLLPGDKRPNTEHS